VHDVRGWRAKGATEVIKVFEIGFVNSVAYYFDVQVIEVGGCKATTKIWGYFIL